MVQGYYCPTHYQVGIDRELEFIDKLQEREGIPEDTNPPADFVVVRKRKDRAQCEVCNDQTRIFVTRGHYDVPVSRIKDNGLDKLNNIEPEAAETPTPEGDNPDPETVPAGELDSSGTTKGSDTISTDPGPT